MAANGRALSSPENSGGGQGQTKAGADTDFSMVRQRKKGLMDKAWQSQWGGAGAQALVTVRLAGGAGVTGPPTPAPRQPARAVRVRTGERELTC